MTYLKGMADSDKAYELFAARPDLFGPFAQFCEALMRGPSPLSRGERELIGTFVSLLNSCRYCHDVHNEAVKAYDFNGDLTRQLLEDVETADVDARLRPLLRLAKKTTESAYKTTQADIDAAYAAGWDDTAIHDTVVVTCMFNFMNRLMSSLGIEADADYIAAAGPKIRDVGYAATLEKVASNR